MEKLAELNYIENKYQTREDEVYKIVCKTIEKWPDWKKEEYNNDFIISKYSDKLVISK